MRQVSVRRLTAPNSALAVLIVSLVSLPSPAADSAATTSCCVLERTTVLSSEDAVAKLTVTNGSTTPVRLETGNITFLSYVSGEWTLSRYCYRDCWRSFVQVEPAAEKTVRIRLPSCQVLSDPCSENVVMQYDIKQRDETRNYKVQLPPYQFVADPTATYDISGLRGNLPVIVTKGFARDSIVPNSISITITTASPAPEMENGLRGWGLAVDRGVETRFGWDTVVHVGDDPRQRQAAINALESVQSRFREQVRIIVEQVRIDSGTQVDTLWRSAMSDATQRAGSLAAVLHIGTASDWNAGSTETGSVLSLANQYGMPIPLDSSGRQYYGSLPLYQGTISSIALPVIVEAAMQWRYIGARPASLIPNAVVDRLAATAFRRACCPQSLLPAVTIAADRPELYSIASASNQASLQAGLSADLTAVLHTREQVLQFAKILGVRTNQESLLVLYPANASDDLRTVGLAMTFSGGERWPWQSISADSGVRTFRSNINEIRSVAPISIHNQETAITETATAQPGWESTLLRLEVEVDSSVSVLSIDRRDILRRLRLHREVIDAAAAIRDGGQRVRYAILVRAVNRANVPRLIDLIKKSYASANPSEVSFSLNPYVADCTRLEQRLIRSSIRQDWLDAQADARSKGLRLRKLLLSAVLPASDASLCPPLMQPIGTQDLDYTEIARLPSTFGPIPISVGSTMVFRTFPPNR